ncbi:uncharacterized protein LOC108117685 [Drosophila eugracilis]|uniref:uncharacterized protein LOC108117685 n=1 Tax=Drosophila eugracilis TaxID=29029 RepID=UPI0007E72029|nr:uncharacterized protein LOC108117685 [Drosophila eugracilis]
MKPKAASDKDKTSANLAGTKKRKTAAINRNTRNVDTNNGEKQKGASVVASEGNELQKKLDIQMALSEELQEKVALMEQEKEEILKENKALVEKKNVLSRASIKLTNIRNANMCGICAAPIDAEGEHRMVAMKCGHIFGDNCIRRRWGDRLDCIHCMKITWRHELRYIYGLTALCHRSRYSAFEDLSDED